MTFFKQYAPLIMVLFFSFIFILLQLDIAMNIWQYSFDDGTYSHAYLVPVITGYLYYELYQEGSLKFSRKLNYFSLSVTLVFAFSLVIFTIAQFTTGYRIFFILFYTSIIALIFENKFRVLFPALFLVFLLPIWGILTPYLQTLSTYTVTYFMGLTGIPTYVEGNFITIPAGVFEIAGGCSGLRYLLVSLSVSSLFIFLNMRNMKHGLIFITIAVLGALFTNWVRIAMLIIIGHNTNMESSLMSDHNTFGWYLYIPFLFFLFYVGQRFSATSSHQSATSLQPSTPLLSSLIFALAILIITSPIMVKSIGSVSKSYDTVNCLNNVPLLPLPQISSPHSLCVQPDEEGFTARYLFKGEELGDSVDYFANKFTPVNLTTHQPFISDGWNELTVEHTKGSFRINYIFKSGQDETFSLRQLKKLKILNAFNGVRSTELIWKVHKIK